MAKRQETKRIDMTGAPDLRTSLADKLKAMGVTPAPVATPPPAHAPAATPKAAVAATSVKGVLSPCAKVVLRMERKGHGGKTVTVVSGTEGMAGSAREPLARRLGKALGCGARVMGNDIVLQGDHRERTPALLEAEGARRVAIG